MVNLPQELLDAIIDEVGVKTSSEPRDFASLNACSLTARAFLPASQRTLFTSLTLKQYKLAQASSVLVSSPHIASYVRDLHLIDAGFIAEPDSDSIRVPLAASFSLLTNITRLAMSFCFSPLGWTHIPANFRAVLVGLLSLPSLRYIALAQCTGVPSSIIRHALISSKQVTLKDVGIYSEDEVFPQISGDVSGATVPLEHLAVFYTQHFSLSIPVYDMLLGGQVASRLDHLRHLELCVTRTGSLGGLEMVAVKSSESLEHLVITKM
ncbi:hypothetical protein B0H17DRAFT_1144018 [Mycena rosella]|uniref:Uncharacterized protein n=1 Tax=Mycena rosella TaxID=1033263 RepID=A0AAD7CU24_MYCRO|nr:hypothetical protein B0H17DRAFT_1144018 [Mycena rosella]